MSIVNSLRKLFGHSDIPPSTGFAQLPEIAGTHYLRTLVRQRDGSFECDSLFMRPQPDIDTDLLVSAIRQTLPQEGSLMIISGVESDESFDYYRISVRSLDLVTKEGMESMAKHIDSSLISSAPAQKPQAPARTLECH